MYNVIRGPFAECSYKKQSQADWSVIMGRMQLVGHNVLTQLEFFVLYFVTVMKARAAVAKVVMFHLAFVCLSDCEQLCVKTTKHVFTKILLEMYPQTRKNWLNFGICLLVGREDTKTANCNVRIAVIQQPCPFVYNRLETEPYR